MDGWRLSLYKTRMDEATEFVESLHYVPEGSWNSAAFSVLRAGRVVAGPDYGIERAFHPGQDILYCLSGAGGVRTVGQRLEVQAGQLVWIANEEPHAHFADPESPWTLLWFRLDGPNLAAVRRRLFGAGPLRVTMPGDAILPSWFDRLFSAMRGREFGQDLRLNQLVGEFFVIVDRALAHSVSSGAPKALAVIVAAMRRHPGQRWSAGELSSLVGLSEFADPPTVREAPAREPARMAAARAADLRPVPDDQRRGEAGGDRRNLRLLRCLSFQPGVQARRRRIPRGLAKGRIGRRARCVTPDAGAAPVNGWPHT